MKLAKGLLAGILVMSLAVSAQAGLSAGGKLWYAVFDADGAESALMLGPTLSIGGDTMWLSGMYLKGSLDEEGGSIDFADSEVDLGFSLDTLDIGVGVRYSEWTSKFGGSAQDIAIWGPMGYLGLGNSFGESALGWYIGASYMFMDLGDAADYEDKYDIKDATFEHFNAEAGLSFSAARIQATLGYRMKHYINYSDEQSGDFGHKGVAASASFVF
jgi:hypothetical protein